VVLRRSVSWRYSSAGIDSLSRETTSVGAPPRSAPHSFLTLSAVASRSRQVARLLIWIIRAFDVSQLDPVQNL
jgi:hypothetical protein